MKERYHQMKYAPLKVHLQSESCHPCQLGYLVESQLQTHSSYCDPYFQQVQAPSRRCPDLSQPTGQLQGGHYTSFVYALQKKGDLFFFLFFCIKMLLETEVIQE